MIKGAAAPLLVSAVHILRNTILEPPKTPPPLCNIVINLAGPPYVINLKDPPIWYMAFLIEVFENKIYNFMCCPFNIYQSANKHATWGHVLCTTCERLPKGYQEICVMALHLEIIFCDIFVMLSFSCLYEYVLNSSILVNACKDWILFETFQFKSPSIDSFIKLDLY